MGAPRALALCFNFAGALEFQTGRWDEAETALRRAVDLYRQVDSASGEALSLQRLGVLVTAMGDTDAGHELLSDGMVVAERAAMRAHCLTRIHASLLRNRLAAEDLEGAQLSLTDGMAAARRHGHCVTCNALLMPELVRAHLALGDVPAAALAADTLEKTAGEFESRAWAAMASHARARVERQRARFAVAHDKFEGAAQTFLEIEQPYDAARCFLGHAGLLRDRNRKADPTEAERLEKKAATIFESIGAPGIEN